MAKTVHYYVETVGKNLHGQLVPTREEQVVRNIRNVILHYGGFVEIIQNDDTSIVIPRQNLIGELVYTDEE